MKEYLALMDNILRNGERRSDRTGTGTVSLWGERLCFDLSRKANGQYLLPIITTKRINLHAVIHELLWFIKGDTNVKYLNDNGVHIWDAWADENGDMGPIYGKQWRCWERCDGTHIDQLKKLQKDLLEDPYSRRHILCTWNVADLDKMRLPPCHDVISHFSVRGEPGRLCAHIYQRSADYFLGVPFNITSYALFTHMLAATLGLLAGDLVVSFGDVHLYLNHIEQAKLVLEREPFAPPHFKLDRKDCVTKYTYEDLMNGIHGYKHHSLVAAPISV